jgi:N-acetylglucosamine-6-phosphate deacetylase
VRLGVAAAVVAGDVVVGDVEVVDGRIAAVGLTPAGATGLAVPGFVDLQVNGYLGRDFSRADDEGWRAVAAELARHGTTHVLATVVSSPLDAYPAALAVATRVVADPRPGEARVLGVHLEGPFLSPARRGAHPEAHLVAPDATLVERWLAAGPVRLVTLAPELPGALPLVAALAERGIVVAMGHSDAGAHQARAAVAAGVRAHTHVWNATRPLTARDPGTAGIALTDPRVAPCFIADLVHVAPEVLTLSIAATSERYVVVSDVSSAAGLPEHRDLDAIRLAGGTLAGGTQLLDAGLRHLLELGRPLPEAVAAVTSRPARLVGAPDAGVLAPGGPADVVVLDDRYEVQRVLVGGADVPR